MNSWDCFDTLVARRFFHPHSIFEEVEKISGYKGFFKLRKSFEKEGNLTYDQIYQKIKDIDSELEFNIELDHCFGIVENINKVNDGDLIISDMYLSESQIRKILKKCGLTKDIKIIVTLDGKKTGTIWKDLPKIDHHVGDNYKSDVLSPSRFNISATHYTGHQFNDVENYVSQTDFQLACFMRYLRLSCPYSTEREIFLWNDQSNLNIPLLILASLELSRDRDISFCYRDCAYWHKIYSTIFNKEGIRLDVSRICYKEKNESFVNYVLEKTKNTLIVDLIGTGESVKEFYKEKRDILYIIGLSDDMGNISHLSPKVKNAIERHNCTDIGPLIGWNNGPVRGDCEHDLEVAKLQKKAVDTATDLIPLFQFNKNINLIHYFSSLMQRNYTHTNVRYVKG
jgi:predicted HAD superfamily hydrolase